MKKFGEMGRLGVAACLAIALASTSTKVRGDEPLPLDRMIGDRVSDLPLGKTEGVPKSLYGYAGKSAMVLVFMGTECPVGNAYIPRLNELAKKYEDKNVVFLGVNSNASESVEKIAAHKKEFGVAFPVVKDEGNKIADMLLAEKTCEVVVLNGVAQVRYRGAIDDQYLVGKQRDKAEHHYLADALDAVIARKPVAVASSKVEGCPIEKTEPKIAKIDAPRVRGPKGEVAQAFDKRDAEAGKIEVGKVTYAEHVASILQNRCENCHRPGQAAPFALHDYDDARRWSKSIAGVVEDRRMPPWHADPRHGVFQNDRSLTAKERATLLAWVEQGGPLGDASKLPAPRTFPEGWTIGKPDMIVEIPKPYVVPAQGTVEYVYMKVPSGFTEDKWIQAAEAVPGDRSVVHHIIVYVAPPRNEANKAQGRSDLERHLCGYAPGDMPSVYPLGTAKRIPKGSDLIFQLHYTPNGKVRTDRSRVGFIFAKGPVEHQAYTRGIAQQRFTIEPGDDNSEVRSSMTFKKDATLLAFMPHMHLRGKDFKYTAVFHEKDGSTREEVLLSVPAYDFAWQSYYTLAKPRFMPAGTEIKCVAHFDNSSANPANPDPKASVRWGDQTFEEMMIGYIDYVDAEPIGAKTAAAEAEAAPAPKPAVPSANQVLTGLRRALQGR